MPMTAQPSEVPTLRVAALPDDQLAQMTLGFLRECYLRLQESDHKNAEMKRVAAIVAEPHKKHGRVTIDIKPFSVLHDVTTGRSYIDSAEMRRRMPDRFETEDLRSVAPELAKSSETMRSFRHFDLEDLHADEVITVDVPLVSYLERTVRTDPTQVALPEGWADELGQKMLAGAAAVVSNLPRPEVVNNVTVEPAPITLLEADDGELDITFDRDSAGRIVKAHTK